MAKWGDLILLLEQAVIFSGLLVWGTFLGFIADCFRILRKKGRLKVWGDLLFWLLATLLTYLFLLWFTWGAVRFYFFIGLAGGFYFYFKCCAPLTRRFLKKGYALLKRATKPSDFS